ncbi:MAG: hypothetical protein QNL88_10975 [Acidobacteriota bacterium]|nr:hypothetical protein [Acidobacteriota bacterium]
MPSDSERCASSPNQLNFSTLDPMSRMLVSSAGMLTMIDQAPATMRRLRNPEI